MIGFMHYTRFYAFAILLLQFFVLNESKMRITEIDTQASYDIKIFNGLPWDTTTTMNQLFSSKTASYIPIIRLDREYRRFDPCDESTMTVKKIEPYLRDFFAVNSQFKREDGWFASFGDYDEISSRCDGNVPEYLIYPSYAARVAQNVGADGAFWLISRNGGEGSGIAATNTLFIGPDVDRESQTALGTKITIPFFTMELFQSIKGQSQDINADGFRWSISLIPSAPQSDENPYEVLSSPTGIYRFVWAIIGVSSLLLAPIISKNCVDIFSSYRKMYDHASRVALLTRMVILIPELLNCVARILVALDPTSLFSTFTPMNANLLYILSNYLSIFSGIVMVIYCWDELHLYKSIGTLGCKPVVPHLILHKYKTVLTLSIVSCMMATEMAIVFLALKGYLRIATIAVPSIYVFIANVKVIWEAYKLVDQDMKFPDNYRKTNIFHQMLYWRSFRGRMILRLYYVIVLDTAFLLLIAYGYKFVIYVLTFLPYLFSLLVNVMVVVYLFKVASLLKRALKASDEHQRRLAEFVRSEALEHDEETTKSIKSGGKPQKVIKKLTGGVSAHSLNEIGNPEQDERREIRKKHILKTRQYIILAAFSRLATIVAYLMIGSNLCYLSALVFGCTFGGAGISGVLSSYFQVFAAQLHKSPQRRNSNKNNNVV